MGKPVLSTKIEDKVLFDYSTPAERNMLSDFTYNKNVNELAINNIENMLRQDIDKIYTAPYDSMQSLVEEVVNRPTVMLGGTAVALAHKKYVDFLVEENKLNLHFEEEKIRDALITGEDIISDLSDVDAAINEILAQEAIDEAIDTNIGTATNLLTGYFKKEYAFPVFSGLLISAASAGVLNVSRNYMMKARNGATKTVTVGESCLFCHYAAHVEIDPNERSWHLDCDCVIVPKSDKMDYYQPWEADFEDIYNAARDRREQERDRLMKEVNNTKFPGSTSNVRKRAWRSARHQVIKKTALNTEGILQSMRLELKSRGIDPKS